MYDILSHNLLWSCLLCLFPGLFSKNCWAYILHDTCIEASILAGMWAPSTGYSRSKTYQQQMREVMHGMGRQHAAPGLIPGVSQDEAEAWNEAWCGMLP